MKKSIFFLLAFASIISFNTKAQTPELWGMSFEGGDFNNGVIFKTDTNGDNQEVVYSYPKHIGKNPRGHLIQGHNGKFYGMTTNGGTYDMGVLFEYDITSNTYTKKIYFDGQNNGSHPYGSLIQASNGNFYGMTIDGGAYDMGVLFEYNPSTNTLINKFNFDFITTGSYPRGSLIQATNGKLYGVTEAGGTNYKGVLFEYDLTTDTYTKKIEFDGVFRGSNPNGTLILATNGKIYGFTASGGRHHKGVLFEYDTTNDTYLKIKDLNWSNGNSSYGLIMQATNGKIYGLTGYGGLFGDGIMFEYDPVTDNLTKKVDFNRRVNGKHPCSLIQASNGKLYGMTNEGGVNNQGVLFEYDITSNLLTKELDFIWNIGSSPFNSLMQASNGKLYGMTAYGGLKNSGVIFEFDTTTNTLAKKINFEKSPNGNHPKASLMLASNGKLYGMTYEGGTFDYGTLFEYNPETETYKKKIDFDFLNGANPTGNLVQSNNGKLYGMTANGGTLGYFDKGVLFEYDPATDILTKKFNFDGVNKGKNPYGSLIQAENGKLYGMTYSGGVNDLGVLFEYNPTTDIYTKKFDFDENLSGSHPAGSLVQADNGKFYGTTYEGGINNFGVLFEYDLATNTYTKKMDFTSRGANPIGSLIQADNGKLYGMTAENGTYSGGVIFEYNIYTNLFVIKYDFNYNSGIHPKGTLKLASNGKLYGLTSEGGANNKGTLFEFDPATETFTKKLDFDGTNGSEPWGELIEITNPNSVENQIIEKNIKISPNPTTNLIKISMPEKPVKVSVVNMAGVLIYETYQTNKEMSIDMSNYAKAVYLVRIQTGKGVATYKVIKQ